MYVFLKKKYWTKTVYPVDECKRTIAHGVRFTFSHGLNKLSKLNDADKSVCLYS